MHYGKKARKRRQFDAPGNVLLGNLGSYHWCGSYFDTYHLPKPKYTPSWQQYSLMAVASFSRIVQGWFEEHNEEFKVLTRPPNSPDLNPSEHLWDELDKHIRSMEAPPRHLQDLKDLLWTSWCHTPSEALWSLCLDGSELFWQHEGDLQCTLLGRWFECCGWSVYIQAISKSPLWRLLLKQKSDV